MCGGLAALVGGGAAGRTWSRLVLYNAARVNTYAALGATAGALGGAVLAWGPLDLAARVLATVGGVAVALVGLEWLGVRAPRAAWLAAGVQRRIATSARELLASGSPWAPLAFGTANAFLPCHLIYAFVAMAASTGSPLGGALTMLAFGLGTVPAMLLAGSGAAALRGRVPLAVGRAAGTAVVLVGLLTIARAFTAMSPHAHH
jgi:sulfite exporter TauE/SafE